MSEPFYICRTWLDDSIGESRFSYITERGGWCKHFGEAQPFTSMDSARTKLNGRPGSIWPESELKASLYYLAETKLAEMKHPETVPEEITLAMQPADKALAKLESNPKSPVTVAGTWERCRQHPEFCDRTCFARH